MRKIVTAGVMTALLAALVGATAGVEPVQARQQCPMGSSPWVDKWGNNICRRHSDQSTSRVEVPRGQTCPTGSYQWTDTWGNKVCRSHATSGERPRDTYDTSKGCPIGSAPWTDKWGNPVCKRP